MTTRTVRGAVLSLVGMLVVGISGCGDTAEPTARPAALPVDAGVVDAGGASGVDTSATDIGQAQDAGGPTDPIAQEVGKGCEGPDDCKSGLCVPGSNGYICTEVCIEDCPSGFSCKANGAGADLQFVCLPVFSTWCKPCELDVDCGGGAGRCVPIGNDGDRYCTQPCTGDGVSSATGCAPGFVCGDNGNCLPETGSCVCTAALNGTTRACTIATESGVCGGVETCEGADGWSECSAPVASPEVCDGLDNNCNGQKDESLVPTPCERSNDWGTCAGTQSCAGEAGWVCDAPEPAAESCDGVDNDCDGLTDEDAGDMDQDGIADCVDTDRDGDGIQNGADNCPELPNAAQGDMDQDGLGNLCDPDLDGDGVQNGDDVCPLVPDDQADADGDGLGDSCDSDADGDGDPDSTDCAPTDAAVHHGAVEACNGQDDNCNGLVDEGFADTDQDGQKDCVDEDPDGDGVVGAADCAPLDPNVAPGVSEVCNGVDDNCDGATDEGFADTDQDGKPDCLDEDTDQDGDPNASDCAPLDGAIFHAQSESCDGQDQNCNGLIDEGFADSDGDGLKDCTDPDDDGDGAADAEDCAPLDPTVAPGATEVCNGVDDNCDGETDEGAVDTDQDGVADCVDSDDDGDGVPDDADNCPQVVNPAQANADGDAMGDACDPDDDNDGVQDTMDLCPTLPNPSSVDTDGDGLGDPCDPDDDGDGSLDGLDCAPLDKAVYPGQTELCDGADNDCDGLVDEGFADSDLDGLKDCTDPDDDNDGVVDDLDVCPTVSDSGQADADQDGLGDACDPDDDGDGSLDAMDCAPLDKAVHPGASEACNGQDDNCNGVVDEGFADTDQDGLKDCLDPDLDGDGVPNDQDNAPNVPNPSQADTDGDGAPDAIDCAPLIAAIYPGQAEACNNTDDDCDGLVDEGLSGCGQSDTDGDGVPNADDNCVDAANPSQLDLDQDGLGDACDADLDGDGIPNDQDNAPYDPNPAQVDTDKDGVGDASDCAPNDAAVYPGATELCDGKDNDCDGAVDEQLQNCGPVDSDGDGVIDGQDNCPTLSNADQLDTDGDGIGNPCDTDLDGDGITNPLDNCPAVFNPNQLDTDGDGLGDVCDAGGGGGPTPTATCGNAKKEAGEACDYGAANSDVQPDACRTDCTLPSCGDGVTDSGEACDDGNPFDADGCSSACQLSAVVGLTLPYLEPFDSASSFEAVGWLAPGSPGFALSGGGPLGPDLHPRFGYAPQASGPKAALLSPILDASAAATVTLSFERALVPLGDGGGLVLSARVSTDSGTSWTEVWAHAAKDGPLAAGTVHVDISDLAAGQAALQVAFRLAGASGAGVIYAEVDNVAVRAGRPPTLAPIPAQVLVAGDTSVVTASASDPDTPAAELSLSLVDPPPFVTLQDNGDGTAQITLAPGTPHVGAYPSVQVRVSDGTFATVASFALTVLPLVENQTLAIVLVRDAAGGGGQVVGDRELLLGKTLTLYAAGYTADLVYLGEQNVVWLATGSLAAVPAGPATSATLVATEAGATGTVKALHYGDGVQSGETGLISVLAGPPGELDLGVSTLSVTKPTLVADGSDQTLVSVALFDQNGQPIATPADVVIHTTGGALLDTVQAAGDGLYTQVLRAPAEVGSAVVSATVDGALLGQTVTVSFVPAEDILGAGTAQITCANYPDWEGKNLLITGGTLTVDSVGCAPMAFGDVIITSTGVLTHSAATADSFQAIDVVVASLRIDTGGSIDVSGRGYPGGDDSTAGLGRTFKGSLDGGAPNLTGGSHGGLGGGSAPGFAYDDLKNPTWPGAGGGYYNNSHPGGAGGGVVRIRVQPTGHLIISGAIRANGETPDGVGAGGAGGSVYLSTPAVFGFGVIEARGGEGQTSYSGGGGGGRFALVKVASSTSAWGPGLVTAHVDVSGGQGVEGLYAGAGSLFVKRATESYGEAIFDNKGHASAGGSTPLVLLAEGTVDAVAPGQVTDFDGLFQTDRYVGSWINPNVAQGQDGLADDALFLLTGNGDQTLSVAGDPSAVAAPGATYRGVLVLDRLRIMGQADVSTQGELRVLAGDLGDATRLTLRGRLSARRLDLGPVETVRLIDGGLDVGDQIVGSNDAQFPFHWTFEAGALTLPALYADTLSGTDMTLETGPVDIAQWADVTGGTATLSTLSATGDVHFEALTTTLDSADVTGVLSLIGGLTTVRETTLKSDTKITIGGDGVLTHAATSAETVRMLDLVAPAVIVDQDARVDVSGRGYLGGNGASGLLGYGPGNQPVVPAQGGGSHGGLGRATGGGGTHPAYDAIDLPVMPGSGGGAYNSSHPGGAGGGVVRILAATAATIHGEVRADGQPGSALGSVGAAGAGGTIVIQSALLSGTGTLSARGAAAEPSYSGGSAGGRIAIRGAEVLGGSFALDALAAHVDVSGGIGIGAESGGAGTVFVKGPGDLYGHLLIDNKNIKTFAGSTPLLVAPEGLVDIPQGGVLSDFDAGMANGEAIGSWLRPDIHANDTDTLADDYFFRVVANDNTSYTAPDGVDLGSKTSGGATYRGLTPLNTFALRGKARVVTPGDLLIMDGELGGADATRFIVDGFLDAHTIDLRDVTTLEVVSGRLVADTLIAKNQADYAFDYALDHSEVELPTLYGHDLVMTGGSLKAGPVTVTGDLHATGGTLSLGSVGVQGTMTLDGAQATATHVSANGGLLGTGVGSLSVSATTVASATSVTLQGGFVMSHADSTHDQVYTLRVIAPVVTIGKDAAIDVSGRGYKGGDQSTGLSPRGFQNKIVGSGLPGGSHGGLGWPSETGVPVYGSPYRPRYPGAGGAGYNNSHPGGDGGGVVEILAGNAVTINGAVRADGAGGPTGIGAGGAGGTIFITTPVISGDGMLTARGGAGHGGYGSGGGGGGRIAVDGFVAAAGGFNLADGAVADHVSTVGGIGAENTHGGAGTVYVRPKSQTFGTLILDNEGQPTFEGSTPLAGAGEGTIYFISENRFTDFDATLTPDAWVDTWVNLDADFGTLSTKDDPIAPITSHTAKELSFPSDLDLATLTAPQKTWRTIWVVDQLELRGGARVAVTGDLRVMNGDLGHGNDEAQTLELQGELSVDRLDLNAVSTIRITGGGALTVNTWIQGESTDAPFALFLDNGSITKPALRVGTLDATDSHVAVAGALELVGQGTVAGGSVSADTITAAGDLDVSGGTWAAGTASIAGDFTGIGGMTLTLSRDLLSVDGTLTLSGAGTLLTQTPTLAPSEVRRLKVVVGHYVQTDGAAVDVSGKGYRGGSQASGGVGEAPAEWLQAAPLAGGSHGGEGRRTDGTPASSYGSLYAPRLPGGGGGYYNNAHPGGDGGGVIELHATGAATIEGPMRANGAPSTGVGAGGAGGSILVEAAFVAGVGPLEANGADGTNGYSSGGGGGGRIALLATAGFAGSFGSESPWDAMSAGGGYGGNGLSGGAGTLFLRVAGADGDLVVDNLGAASFEGSTPLPFGGSGQVDALDVGSLTDHDATFPTGDWLKGYTVNPNVAQGTPSLGDDVVYAIGGNDNETLSLPGGDPQAVAAVGDTWSAYYRFDRLAVRGGARLRVDGQLRVDQGDFGADPTRFAIAGELSTGTMDLAGVDTVVIQGADAALTLDHIVNDSGDEPALAWEIEGTLTKSSLGASSLSTDGGRVVATGGMVIDGALTTSGGSLTTAALSADSATLAATDMTAPSVVVANGLSAAGGTWVVDTLEVGANAIFEGGAKVTIGQDLVKVGGGLTLSGAGTVLSQAAMADETVRKLRLEVGNLLVDAGAAIDVTGKGYPGGDPASGGVGAAPYGSLRAQPSAGGGHGGLGRRTDGTPAPTYGSLVAPAYPGGGGGYYNDAHPGGAGGGLVEVFAGTGITVNGVVRANGGASTGVGAGGAGGGIRLQAPVIAGGGSLEARGAGGSNGYNSGGGGGGRIALVASGQITGAFGNATPWLAFDVSGGYGGGSLYAGAGTVYLKAGATAGDLLVDNRGHKSFADSTPLPFRGTGTVDVLTQTTLTDYDGGFLAANMAVTYRINPNTAQGTPSLADDMSFEIASGDTQAVTILAGDLTQVAAAGATWAAFYAFDNLEVRGQAQLFVDGQLWVKQGDVASADATTLRVDGGLHAGTLDVAQVSDLRVVGAAARLEVATLIGAGQVDPGLALTVEGALKKTSLSVGSLVATGAAIEATTLSAAGDVTLTDSTSTVGDWVVTGDLELSGGTATAQTITAGGDLVLSGSAQVEVTGENLDAGGTIAVLDTATLTHAAPVGGAVARLALTASDVLIAADARIDVDGKGWAGQAGAQGATSWPGDDTTMPAAERVGGSHGGLGGTVSGQAIGAAYGRYDAPRWPGAGGGMYTAGHPGGRGGGVVRISADASVTVHGAISANGEDPSGVGAGGAGGAIFIQAQVLSGDGTLSADGGAGQVGYDTSGGGGGRIALVGYTTLGGSFAKADLWTRLTAHGAAGAGNLTGGAGTLFMRAATDTYGRLIVDNGGAKAHPESTPLLDAGSGTVSALTNTTLTDASAVWPAPDYLTGQRFRADLGYNASQTLTDDVLQVVSGNSMNTLTVSGGGLTALSQVGKTYRGITPLDKLQVGGGAQLITAGDLLVLSGSVSGGAASFTVDADSALTAAHQLELVGVSQAAITGAVTAAPLVCADCP